jgi:hypothetical protein
MFDLNAVLAIHQADPRNMLDHILNLPQQLEDGWAAAAAIDLPTSFRAIDRVLIAGMGTSAMGGSLLASLMARRAACRSPSCAITIYPPSPADRIRW